METRKLSVLVVDDDKVTRRIHGKMLENVGIVKYQVVQNGKEAIDAHLSGQVFDIILMDLYMPIMNGIEATKELRSMGIRSKIVGVSGSSNESHISEFVESGLDLFHVKPFTNTKLASILEKINPKSN